MGSRSKKDLHATAVQAFEMAEARFNEKYPELPNPFLTCTHRTGEEQNKEFAKGRNELGQVVDKGKIVTNAKAGQSPHNYIPSLAFDIAFTDSRGKLDWSAHLFEKFNQCLQEVSKSMVWGFDWNGNGIKDANDFDRPHWELKNWKNFINKI